MQKQIKRISFFMVEWDIRASCFFKGAAKLQFWICNNLNMHYMTIRNSCFLFVCLFVFLYCQYIILDWSTFEYLKSREDFMIIIKLNSQENFYVIFCTFHCFIVWSSHIVSLNHQQAYLYLIKIMFDKSHRFWQKWNRLLSVMDLKVAQAACAPQFLQR